MNTFKTTLFMVALGVLLMGFGYVFGGLVGAGLALVASIGLNVGMYWYGHKIVLKQYNAEELSENDAPAVHRVVSRLSEKAGIPKPDIYLIPDQNPNAFATGRNPEHAIIGVTQGILDLLDEDELEGVLAHELSHVINRDTLISTIAASIAGAISLLAIVGRYAAIFGMGGRDQNNNIFVILAMSIIAPIAATIIQMAVSRSREFKADRSGADLCGKPMSLARALRKMEDQAERRPMQRGSRETAHLFIVNPFSLEGLTKLFSTHPSVDDRVNELEKMARDL
jgi:heat shock protein HtpX